MSDELCLPSGFRAAAVRAGIKPSGGLDLAVLAADGPCSAAGTFTTNRVCAAPVKWDRARVPAGDVRAIVVNAGNANAATGARGDADVRTTAVRASEALGCRPDEVLVASTGVIGHHLPIDNLLDGLGRAVGALSADESAFRSASEAILTTDTRPKLVSHRETIGGRPVSLLGLAKG